MVSTYVHSPPTRQSVDMQRGSTGKAASKLYKEGVMIKTAVMRTFLSQCDFISRQRYD